MQENIILTRALILLIISALSTFSFAQYVPQTSYKGDSQLPDWAELMYEHPNEVQAIRSEFEIWRELNPEVKNQHSQFYKRWLRQVQAPKPEVDVAYAASYKQAQQLRSGEWEQAGPWHYDPEVAMYFQVQSPGACHVYTVEQSYSNPEVVYCGTATSGMYKSSNKGLNWELITEELPVTSVYSIEIDRNDENLVWLGEGGGKLYRSEDGGENWTICGGSTFANSSKWYRTLMLTDEGLFAATNEGLWFSADNGTTMELIAIGEYMELEQHPTNPDILYTVRLSGSETVFMRSDNGGDTFSEVGVGAGWPDVLEGEEQKRAEISVSPADPDKVYALCSGSTPDGGGLFGYYVSSDSGETFEFSCCGDGPEAHGK